MLFTLLTIAAAMASQPSTSTLEVEVAGLRNSKGVIQACLTQDRVHFPDCKADRHAIKQTVNAATGALVFTGLEPGDYALALFHDENRNGRLDTVFGIPKEGFGFSRNPVVRFGAPRYDKTNIELPAGVTRMRVRLQYLL